VPVDELTIPRIRKWMELYRVTPRMLAAAVPFAPSHMRRILAGQRRLLPEHHATILAYFQAIKAEHHRIAAIMADLDACA
jgi:hypothetical protein